MSTFFIPNALTVGRLLAIPLVLYLLLRTPETPAFRYYAVLILVAQQLSDVLDGYLARRIKRRRGGENRFGAILDPVADKLFVGSTFVVLSATFGFPWWITLTILGKDVLLLSGWLLRARLYGIRTVRPNFFGKAADSLQAFFIFAFLLQIPARILNVWTAVMVLFTVLAGVVYFVVGFREISKAGARHTA